MCYIIIKDDGDNMQKMKDKEMALSCIFRFDEKDNVCYAKINKNHKKGELLEIFHKNIKKFTFLGIILPCVSFLLIFLLTILFITYEEIKGNFITEEFNLFVSLSFLSLLFLVLGVILLYKLIVKKEKCYLTMYYGAYRYKYISYKKYKNIVSFLNERTENYEKNL